MWYTCTLIVFSIALTPPTHQQSPPYQSPAGTLLYMSPEQLSSKRYDRKVDMFALGVTFFEMYCPFQTDMERFKVGVASYGVTIHASMLLHIVVKYCIYIFA